MKENLLKEIKAEALREKIYELNSQMSTLKSGVESYVFDSDALPNMIENIKKGKTEAFNFIAELVEALQNNKGRASSYKHDLEYNQRRDQNLQGYLTHLKKLEIGGFGVNEEKQCQKAILTNRLLEDATRSELNESLWKERLENLEIRRQKLITQYETILRNGYALREKYNDNLPQVDLFIQNLQEAMEEFLDYLRKRYVKWHLLNNEIVFKSENKEAEKRAREKFKPLFEDWEKAGSSEYPYLQNLYSLRKDLRGDLKLSTNF